MRQNGNAPTATSPIQQAMPEQPPADRSPVFNPKSRDEHVERVPSVLDVREHMPPPDPPVAMRPESHFDFGDGLRLGIEVFDLGRDDLLMHVIALDAGPFGAKVDSENELHRHVRRRMRHLFTRYINDWHLRPEVELIATDGYVHHLYPLHRKKQAAILERTRDE